MTHNPYHSPASVSSAPRTQKQYAPDRPVGVSILSVLHGIGGIALLGLLLVLIGNLEAMADTLQQLGIPPVLLLLGVFFLAALAAVSAIGMWIGAKWGWWSGAFYYMYGIFRNATTLFTIAVLGEELELGGEDGPGPLLVQHSVRLVIQALIFVYLLKGNVLEFFDLEDLSKFKATGILAGICLAITVAISAVSWFSTS